MIVQDGPDAGDGGVFGPGVFGGKPGQIVPDLAEEQPVIVGGPARVQERIGEYAAAGVERIMLQWLDLEDLERLEALAEAVLSQ